MTDFLLSLKFLDDLPGTGGVLMLPLLFFLLPVPGRGPSVVRRLLGQRHVTLLDTVRDGSVGRDLLNVHTGCFLPVRCRLK